MSLPHLVVFWDIDGVTRLATEADGTNPQFIPVLCKRVRQLAESTGALLVSSSQWRLDHKLEEIAELHGMPMMLMHPDQLNPEIRDRGAAIIHWLALHHEAKRYVILDDESRHFEGSPAFLRSKLVLCNSRFGFVSSLEEKARRILLRAEKTDNLSAFTGGDETNDSDL